MPDTRLRFEADPFTPNSFGMIAEYKCPCCGNWVEAWSCWEFEDTEPNGYEPDAIEAAMQALGAAKAKVTEEG